MSLTTTQPNGQFDTGAVAVAAASGVLVLELALPQLAGGRPFSGYLSLFGQVGAGAAITHLVFVAVDPVLGTEITMKSDADFNTKDEVCPYAGPGATPNVHTTAANGTFLVLLQRLDALTKIRVYAGTASATTLRLTGSVR